MKGNNPSSFRVFLLIFSILGLFCLMPGHVAALTVTPPSTWNIIGLDSNIPAAGPNRFPVGAKVCRSETVTNVDATLIRGPVNPIICLRPGSLNLLIILSIAAGICANVFFEVEVNYVASAFDTFPQYHITAGASPPSKPVTSTLPRLQFFCSEVLKSQQTKSHRSWCLI